MKRLKMRKRMAKMMMRMTTPSEADVEAVPNKKVSKGNKGPDMLIADNGKDPTWIVNRAGKMSICMELMFHT